MKLYCWDSVVKLTTVPRFSILKTRKYVYFASWSYTSSPLIRLQSVVFIWDSVVK
jgi:hypothetical protein